MIPSDLRQQLRDRNWSDDRISRMPLWYAERIAKGGTRFDPNDRRLVDAFNSDIGHYQQQEEQKRRVDEMLRSMMIEEGPPLSEVVNRTPPPPEEAKLDADLRDVRFDYMAAAVAEGAGGAIMSTIRTDAEWTQLVRAWQVYPPSWPKDAGPPPGAIDCLAPQHLLPLHLRRETPAKPNGRAAEDVGPTPPRSDPPEPYASADVESPSRREHPHPEAQPSPKPKSRDINDVKAERDTDGVREMFDATKPGAVSEWPALDMRLLDDDCVLPPKLEDDALPAGWGSWITTEAAARDCPRDYVAAGLIGAASAWIGNGRRIIATSDWSEPVNVWIDLIGVPSAGKTPGLRSLIAASRGLERDAEPAWREDLAQYKRDSEVAKTLEKTWLDSVRTAAKEKTTPPDRPTSAQEPDAPIRPRLVAMDTSTEELQKMLSENPRGLLYVRDELAGWLGALDRYGGHGADRAFFLECWNGGVYVCDRVRYHGDPVRIEHATLAIIGGMVPDRLRETLAGADDGLTARLIYIWPDPVPISPLVDRGDEEAAQRRNTLAMAARALRALPMGVDDHGSPAPRALRLDPDAFKLFDEMRRAAMQRSRVSHGLSAGWHGKNPGRILRLALVYELLAWTLRNDAAELTTVSPESVARAGGYLDYAGGMLDRVTAGLALTQAEGDAAVIARHLLATRPSRFNARAFYQTASFAWARDTRRLNAALEVLNAAGWIRRPDGGARGRPSSDWNVSPRLNEPAHD